MFANSAALIARNRGRVPLAEIDAVVATRLGPGRVPGNSQPAAFSRQVGMYLASQVCGWSTTRIGKFYNGRDHSTVCYAVARIRTLRESDPEVDGLLSVLSSELRDRTTARQKQNASTKALSAPRLVTPLLDEALLDTIAERIAKRILETFSSLQMAEETHSRYRPQ